MAQIVQNFLLLVERADVIDLVPLVERQVSNDNEEDHFRDLKPLDRARYEELHREPLGEDERPMLFLEKVRYLVIDPSLPHPQGERLEALRNTWREILLEYRLQMDSASTREDHFFCAAVAAVAAWMPEEGAEVVRRQMEDLPARFRKDQHKDRHWWVYSIRRHAVLAEGPIREALSAAAETPCSEGARAAPGVALLSLIPGMTPVEIAHAIVHHSLGFEWHILYDFATRLDVAALWTACSEILEQETALRERVRIYFLLSDLGDGSLPESQCQIVRRDVEEGDPDLRIGALGVASACGVRNIRPDRLLTNTLDWEEENRKLFGPRYASWLLIQEGCFFDRLLPYWRAVDAALHPARRERFLAEIEGAFESDGEEENLFLIASCMLPFRDGLKPTRERLSFAEKDEVITIFRDESEGDLGGLDYSLGPAERKEYFNADLRTEKWNNLVQADMETLRRCREKHETAWSSEQFPQEVVDSLEDARFERWVAVLSRDPRKTWLRWMGLVIPLFRRALLRGLRAARELWGFVNPLPHQRGPGGVQYLKDGIDWVFHELSLPQANEDLAREFLRMLILDARTDQQLFEIALGARCQEQDRLLAVVDELLKSQDAEVRARSVRLLGWLEGTEDRLREVELADPSLWVRGLAEGALKNRQRESFALHWLGRFLRQDLTREQRWGAGQLFLASVDGTFEAWAYRFLREAAPDVRTRGEALLLLDAARDEVKQNRSGDLEKYFLGTEVSDLENGCHPWRRQRSWREIERRW